MVRQIDVESLCWIPETSAARELHFNRAHYLRLRVQVLFFSACCSGLAAADPTSRDGVGPHRQAEAGASGAPAHRGEDCSLCAYLG